MYFQVKRGDEIYGPYTVAELERYLGTGNILQSDLARPAARPGEPVIESADWQPLPEVLRGAQPAEPVPGNRLEQVLYGAPATEKPVWEYPWFPVTPLKFVVMSLCTLGLYHVYWCYQNWNREASRTREGMMVWARAVFLGLFNFSLFSRIRRSAQEAGTPVGWQPAFLGVVVLVFAGIAQLHGAIALLSLLSFVPYLPVVSTIQKTNQAMSADVTESLNSRFSGWNIVGIVVGGVIVLLSMVGLLLPGASAAK